MEGRPDDRGDGVLVLHEEHCLRTARDVGEALRLHHRLGLPGYAWQVDLERRAPADLRVNLDGAAPLLDDPVDGRESESGPALRALRREEGLEDARLRLLVHSG